ncbi:hypothetical protein B566_EDAN011776 [Ephemera danica]|nr:hypothetical protein B566_EDAN011776 [Ephemera danica]
MHANDVIAMRKNRFFFFIFGSLCSWAVVTYFLFLHRPQGSRTDDTKASTGEEQIAKLESELRQQFEANEEFLSRLRQIVQMQQAVSEQRAEQGGAEEQRQQEEEVEQNLADADQRIQDLESQGAPQNTEPVIAVLVFSCNRVTVTRCLDQLIKFRPSKQQFPIVVTQDCAHQPTADAIASYGDLITHIQQPDQSDIIVPPKEKKFKGYFKIARHYGWALNETFFRLNYETVIVVEDDLDVAPDFFEYFLGTHPLLRQDRSIFCVSAWNDNGKAGLVDEEAADLLYRTDFFPGLGWMLTRDLWVELSSKWPKSGLFYEKHLKFIKLNEKFVPFTQKNLTYLLKDNYDVHFVRQIYDSPVVTYQELKSNSITHQGPVRIQYHTKDIFKRTAKMLGLMDDFKQHFQLKFGCQVFTNRPGGIPIPSATSAKF